MRLGHIVLCAAFRNPALTAKMISTLDVISGGRMELGIGAGWKRDEWLAYGYGFPSTGERLAILRDQLEVITRMLAGGRDDQATFGGEHASVARAYNVPKPLQQPRPPVLIGAAPGPTLFAHVAEFGDGWIPIGGGGIRAALPELRRAFEARGRDPSRLHVVPMGVFPEEGKLAYYREQGVTECVLRLPSAPRECVLPVLDDYARHVGRYE